MIQTAAVSVLVVVTTFATGIALARILGPEGRGYYGTVLVIAQFCISFFTFSLFEAAVLRIRHRGEDPRTRLPFVLFLAICLFAFVGLIGAVAHGVGWLRIEALSPYQAFGLMAAIIAIGFMNQAVSAIESSGLSFWRINFERLFSAVFFLCAAVALWVLEQASVMAVLLAFILTKLPFLIVRLHRFRHHLIGPIEWRFAREVFGLGPRLHTASGTLAFSSQADRLIIIGLWPAEWLAFYFVAYSATGAGLSIASQAIGMTLLPSLAGLPRAEQREKIEQLFRLALTAALLVMVPLWLAAPVLVSLAYGADFAPAAGYVQGLIFSMVFMPAMSVVNTANRSHGVGRPGVEVALTVLTVIAVGYGLTRFEAPTDLFITLAFGQGLGLCVGMRHLVNRGVMVIGLNLLPRFSDVSYLIRTGAGHAMAIASRLTGRQTAQTAQQANAAQQAGTAQKPGKAGEL